MDSNHVGKQVVPAITVIVLAARYEHSGRNLEEIPSSTTRLHFEKVVSNEDKRSLAFISSMPLSDNFQVRMRTAQAAKVKQNATNAGGSNQCAEKAQLN